MRIIYWLCHRNIWIVPIPVLIIFASQVVSKRTRCMVHLPQFNRMGASWAVNLLPSVLFLPRAIFQITYILLKLYQQKQFSCYAVAIQVSKHCKVSFSTLQSKLTFYKGSGNSAFTVGDVGLTSIILFLLQDV